MEIKAYKVKDQWSRRLVLAGVLFLILSLIYGPLIYIALPVLVLGITYHLLALMLSMENDAFRVFYSVYADNLQIKADGETIPISEISSVSYKDENLRISTDRKIFRFRLLRGQLEKIVDLKRMLKGPTKISNSAIKNGFDIRYQGTEMMIDLGRINDVQPSRLKTAMENIIHQVVIRACTLQYGNHQIEITENHVDKVLSFLHNNQNEQSSGDAGLA